MKTTPLRALTGALVILLAACSAPPAAPPPQRKSEAPVVSALPGGTPIALELTSPADGALVAGPAGSVRVAGTVSVGDGEPQLDTTLLYVLDATAQGDAAATCGAATTVLGCELGALSALNARAAALPTVGDVGAVIFGAGAGTLDVSPAAGAQPLVAPGADAGGDAGPDVLEALASVKSDGTAAKFTAVTTGTGPTQVGSGLEAAFAIAATSTRPARTIVLLSASTSAAGPGPGELAVPDGTVVRAFALPGTTCAAGLAAFAALGAKGSGCEDVTDLATLSDHVVAVLDAALSKLELAVDGGAPIPLAADELPAAAPFSTTFEQVVPGLAAGPHELCVEASGQDAGGPGSAKACASVTVATIAIAPLEKTYELGTPGQKATVTATVAAGAAGGVAGVPVVFTVTGPNAGKGKTVETDAEGRAELAYEATQGLLGLGEDGIEACFTDAAGTPACATATVTWVDTTPPVVACLPGPNPSGTIVKQQGGVSPSGFMLLVARDAVDPAPMVFVIDTGTGTTWGPFPSGKAVKYTQAPGAAPSASEMGAEGAAGIEVLHLKGKGDPALRGRDAAGNESKPPLVCPVPPFNK